MSSSDGSSGPAGGPAAGRAALSRWLPAAFLIAVMILGALSLRMKPVSLPRPAISGILSGALTSKLQSSCEAAFSFRGTAVSVWVLIRYRLFREGSEEVLVGEDGWLFSSESFNPPEDLGGPVDEALLRIEKVRDALDRKGIALVIALVPSKARVYQEKLGRYRVPPRMQDRYESVLERIHSLGIEAPDLLGPLRKAAGMADVYLRTDTHWSRPGAEVATEVLAGAIRPILDAKGSPRVRFVTEPTDTIDLEGDLLSFIPLGPWKMLGPGPDRVDLAATRLAETESQGLFDALSIPVTLVGTSYSAPGAWNFDGALKAALSADVLNVSAPGKGFLVPMEAYLENPSIDDPRPDVVVWEIPARYIAP